MTNASWLARVLAGAGRRPKLPLAVRRTRAGRHQLAAGAWSWIAVDREGLEVAGSQWPLRELRRAAVSIDTSDIVAVLEPLR
jgi:hypothetical protein